MLVKYMYHVDESCPKVKAMDLQPVCKIFLMVIFVKHFLSKFNKKGEAKKIILKNSYVFPQYFELKLLVDFLSPK